MLADELDETLLFGYIQGLRRLHEMKLVHGDMEPRHLCIDKQGRAAIIDFGEARALDCPSNSPRTVWDFRGKS